MASDYEKGRVGTATDTTPTTPTSTTQVGGHGSETINKLEKYDKTKPTIINYWADWCGPSNRFLPNWKEFVAKAKANFPELQVLDLNVGKDKKKNELAMNVGVEGYPTIVVFYKGKKHPKVAGKMTAEDVNTFVKGIINK